MLLLYCKENALHTRFNSKVFEVWLLKYYRYKQSIFIFLNSICFLFLFEKNVNSDLTTNTFFFKQINNIWNLIIIFLDSNNFNFLSSRQQKTKKKRFSSISLHCLWILLHYVTGIYKIDHRFIPLQTSKQTHKTFKMTSKCQLFLCIF